MLVQVKKKAQITIPLRIRKAVGIDEGDMLNVEVKDKEIVLKPIKRKKIELRLVDIKEFSKLRGILSLGGDAVKDTEAIYEEDNI